MSENNRNENVDEKAVKSKGKYEQGKLFVLNEKEFLRISPQLAKEIGLNECLMLLQLEFLIATSGKERDGRLWVYESVSEWQAQLPFLSKATINRTVRKLIETKLIRATGEYNKKKYDRTRWFSINEDECAKLPGLKVKSRMPPVIKAELPDLDAHFANQIGPDINQNDIHLNQIETDINQIETTIPEKSTDNQTDTSTKNSKIESTVSNTVDSKIEGDPFTSSFQGFYLIASKTCQIDEGDKFSPYLRSAVRDLIDKGYTSENAQLVDEQWYGKWPGTTRPPRIKEYSANFTSLLTERREAKERLAEEMWVRNADVRRMERDKVEKERQSNENVSNLLQEREAAGQPPIHCNCKGANGSYLSASVEGHLSRETVCFRCHDFEWLDEGICRRRFKTQCGFEVRVRDFDNSAPQRPITPEQCQKVRPEESTGAHALSSFNGLDLSTMFPNRK